MQPNGCRSHPARCPLTTRPLALPPHPPAPLQAVAANAIAGRAFVNTQYATAVAMLTFNALEVIFPANGAGLLKGHPTAVGAACGAVTGLVVITPACGFVSNMWAYFIGFAGTAVVYFTPRLLKPLGVDDRLDAFAFHGVGGMMGSLLTGLFASTHESSPVDGAFYFNAPLFGKQIACILVTVLLCVVMTSVIYWVLWGISKAFRTDMRILDEDERDPDASQHGETAYTASKRNLEEFKADRVAAAAAPAKPKAAAALVAVPADGAAPPSAAAPAVAAAARDEPSAQA